MKKLHLVKIAHEFNERILFGINIEESDIEIFKKLILEDIKKVNQITSSIMKDWELDSKNQITERMYDIYNCNLKVCPDFDIIFDLPGEGEILLEEIDEVWFEMESFLDV